MLFQLGTFLPAVALYWWLDYLFQISTLLTTLLIYKHSQFTIFLWLTMSDIYMNIKKQNMVVNLKNKINDNSQVS